MIRILLTVCLLCLPLAAEIALTGNVQSDFAGTNFMAAFDGGGDVGLPATAPAGTLSGWDIEEVYFYLDPDTEQFLTGIKFFTLAGDADDDGGEGTTSEWLAARGGLDLPALAGTESICIAFDFDFDFEYEIIAGVGAVDGEFRFAEFSPSEAALPFAFGNPLPQSCEMVVGQDVEFRICSALDFIQFLSGDTYCFRFKIFAGSMQDDGIGEDMLADIACYMQDCCGEVMAAETPSTLQLQAFPNPFNPVTRVEFQLMKTQHCQLEIYSVDGRLLRTLYEGLLEAGMHDYAFSGSGISSGIYFARLQTEESVSIERLLFLK